MSIASIYFRENVTIDTILGDVIHQQMKGYVIFKGFPYAEHARRESKDIEVHNHAIHMCSSK